MFNITLARQAAEVEVSKVVAPSVYVTLLLYVQMVWYMCVNMVDKVRHNILVELFSSF